MRRIFYLYFYLNLRLYCHVYTAGHARSTVSCSSRSSSLATALAMLPADRPQHGHRGELSCGHRRRSDSKSWRSLKCAAMHCSLQSAHGFKGWSCVDAEDHCGDQKCRRVADRFSSWVSVARTCRDIDVIVIVIVDVCIQLRKYGVCRRWDFASCCCQSNWRKRSFDQSCLKLANFLCISLLHSC